MADRKPWVEVNEGHGIASVQLSDWPLFYRYIHEEMLNLPNYVYRGQRQTSPTWKLESTFDRLVTDKEKRSVILANHLDNFQEAVLGRRGANPPHIEKENDWWALGQHHGLATPLLDWSTSPFVAAFFAFADEGSKDQTDNRVIYTLSRTSVKKISAEIISNHSSKSKPPILEFYRPKSDENPRLLNQSGLFSRVHDGSDIETWMRTHIPADHNIQVLVKILVPDSERGDCLKALNRMNINHLSLFPDLYGACKYCNLKRVIKRY